jgi:hypothetical protein
MDVVTYNDSFIDEDDYLDYVAQLHRQWKDSKAPEISARKWLEHAPEMKKRCEQLLLERYNEIEVLEKRIVEKHKEISKKIREENLKLVYTSLIEHTFGVELKKCKKSADWYRRALLLYSPNKQKTGIDENDVEEACLVPLETIIPGEAHHHEGKLFYCCVFHEEKTPSMFIDTKDNHYHCFGCGAHGNAINMIMKIEKLDFIHAVKYLTGIK